MKEYHKVSLIGSGNVSTNLALSLEKKGHTINEIYSLNSKNSEKLTRKLYQASVNPDLDFSNSQSKVFIISVTDQEIKAVAEKINLPEHHCILVHTSGTVPLEVLSGFHSFTGVFYPLQTFTKEKILEFKNIPICIEGSDNTTSKVLLAIGKSLSDNVYWMDSSSRKKIHLAAVFASNFSNHMLLIAKELMENQDLDFNLLEPLIVETINKSLTLGPEKTQTGPAIREDLRVIKEHLSELEGMPELADIYRIISEHIVKKYN